MENKTQKIEPQVLAHEVPVTPPTDTVPHFFPFQDEAERQGADLSRRAGFPIVGISALVASLGLVALSAVVLVLVQGPGKVVSDWTVQVWHTSKHFTIPKPAAILSVLLSFIGISLHIALSEGANVAWWYYASRSDATVKDLHTMWTHGTSTTAVAKSGAIDIKRAVMSFLKPADQRAARRTKFTYLALASLFVATIPVNGVLLQNAVVVKSISRSDFGNFSVPMATDSLINTGHLFDSEDTSFWTRRWAEIIAKGVTKANTFARITDFNTSCPDTCTATIEGFGFNFDCTDSLVPYDIPQFKLPTVAQYSYLLPDSIPGLMTFAGVVLLNISIYSESGGLTLDMLWKNDENCNGNFARKQCKMRPAVVKYPIVVKSGVEDASQTTEDYTLMMLNPNSTLGSPSSLPIIRGPFPDRGSAQAGLSALSGYLTLFQGYFNARARLLYTNNYESAYYTFTTRDDFAREMIGFSNFDAIALEFTNDIYKSPVQVCNGTFNLDVGEAVIAGLQKLTFLSSAYMPQVLKEDQYSPDWNWDPINNNAELSDVVNNTFFAQHAGQRTWTENQYIVQWKWFFASLGVTVLIAAAIAPTFWGFWRLERKTTMSPFDTARVFPTQVVNAVKSDVRADELLKEVGGFKVRQDTSI